MEPGLLLLAAFLVFWAALYYAFRGRTGRIQVYPFVLIFRVGVVGDPLPPAAPVTKAIKLAGLLGVAVMLLVMALFYVFAVRLAIARHVEGGGAAGDAGIVPLIPGVTIPLGDLPYVLIAVGLAALVHEAAHAIVARAEGIRVKNGGFALFAFIPAAFVELDEESLARAPLLSKLKVFSAGVASNVAFYLAAAALLSALLPALTSGVVILSVVPGSPAEQAGLQPGDVIKAVNGVEVKTLSDLSRLLSEAGVTDPGREAVVTLTVERPGSGLVEVTVVKPAGEARIGVQVANKFSNPLGPTLVALWQLNLGLAAINAAPLVLPLPGAAVLSDGAHVAVAVLERLAGRTGRALGIALGVATLLLVLSLLTLTPLRISP